MNHELQQNLQTFQFCDRMLSLVEQGPIDIVEARGFK